MAVLSRETAAAALGKAGRQQHMQQVQSWNGGVMLLCSLRQLLKRLHELKQQWTEC
jgi:hypothetical protein